MAKFNLSLLLHVSLVLAFAASSNANASGPHRRDHVDLGRLARKRAPAGILPSAQTPSTSSTAQPTQTTPVNSVSVQTTSQPASASASNSPSTTNGGSLSSSAVSTPLSTQSSSAPSSVPTSSSTSSSLSSTPQTPAQASSTPMVASTQSAAQSVLYLTASNSAAPSQTSSASASTSSSTSMSHAAMTAIIVIAASVGAAVIVWTIIRKWKFRPSSDFEGRMQPIDWQPGGSNEDGGFSGQGSLSRASSFHSGPGSGHGHDQMQGPMGGYGAPALHPIPDHDFTAGPAHLAPVGGYADLARGPSPQPMMQEPLGRAPSINTPVQCDQYGVPLHHGYSGY